MTNKYIIKNCPAILKMTKICDDYRTTRDNPQLCKDCTDCLMKKIVELCKSSIRENERDIYRAGRMSLAINILGLLDIEDAEYENTQS